jgi:predicted nicotinamide N-methyase
VIKSAAKLRPKSSKLMSNNLKTKRQTFHLDNDNTKLSVAINRATNVDELIEAFFALDENDAAYQDEQIPYWADLWHSAVALGEFLVKEKLIQKGMKVTEIGCGLGFTGIVASKLGAKVIFTDYIQAAVDFAEENWQLNEANPAHFETMDWRNPNPNFTADLILAADVAYEKDAYPPLLKTFKALCQQGNMILLSDPNRQHTRPFMQRLEKEGFLVSEYSMEQKLDDSTVQVNIFKLIRQ